MKRVYTFVKIDLYYHRASYGDTRPASGVASILSDGSEAS
jgi:hypothetical protein